MACLGFVPWYSIHFISLSHPIMGIFHFFLTRTHRNVQCSGRSLFFSDNWSYVFLQIMSSPESCWQERILQLSFPGIPVNWLLSNLPGHLASENLLGTFSSRCADPPVHWKLFYFPCVSFPLPVWVSQLHWIGIPEQYQEHSLSRLLEVVSTCYCKLRNKHLQGDIGTYKMLCEQLKIHHRTGAMV